MIVFSAIVPHPPMSMPGIGQRKDLEQLAKTLASFELLREELEKARPETIIVISPHAYMKEYNFIINSAPQLVGNLQAFGLDQDFEFKNDTEIADKIAYACEVNEFPCELHPSFLDHGTIIPLYHLAKNIQAEIVQLSFSLMNYHQHFRYGEIIRNVLDKYPSKRIALIASGDLSHRGNDNSPMGFSPDAANFDHSIIRHLANNDLDEILGLRDDVLKEAAECGIRSIIIMLGILHDKQKCNFKFLSYESPYGIGYLVARLL